jgi:hypothetical protein
VTYKIVRPDFLVVSGLNGVNGFYTRVARGQVGEEALLRGFTMSWPTADKSMANIAVAVANSFDPFPARRPARPPVADAPAAAAPVAAPAQPAARRLLLAATAVNLGGDKAVAAIGACEGAEIAGHAAKSVKRDDKTSLALFDVPGLGGKGLARPRERDSSGGDALALYRAAASGSTSETMLAPAELLDRGGVKRVRAPIGEAGAGGPVFSRAGAFLGLVGARPAPAAVAGVVPQAAWPLIPAEALADFVPAASSASEASAAPAAADVVAMAKDAVLSVSCLR